MTLLAPGMSWVDLQFLGRPHAIAAALIQGPAGTVIIDPGPTTCLATLDLALQQHGTRWTEVTAILLTHIHLDHAGATGTIVREHPGIAVYVHERGAPHMINPEKLIASATRLYGDQMDVLWGEFAAVPQSSVIVLRGGERIEAGGRTFEVAYTPGHAAHHVSYFNAASGVAFVGDTAGVAIDGGYVLPPTPPPDINIEQWRESVAAIEAWSPGTLFLTHFGPATQVRPHLQSLLDNLERAAGWVRDTLDEPGTDEERAARYAERLRHDLRRHMTETQMASYPIAAPFEQLWSGLARYWRKKAGQ